MHAFQDELTKSAARQVDVLAEIMAETSPELPYEVRAPRRLRPYLPGGSKALGPPPLAAARGPAAADPMLAIAGTVWFMNVGRTLDPRTMDPRTIGSVSTNTGLWVGCGVAKSPCPNCE